MSDKLAKEKKAWVNVSVPDIARIGKRTFYIGLAALVLGSVVSAICVFKAPDVFLTMEFIKEYFNSIKEIVVIVLLGKMLAEKKK